ncbi:repressor [Escherichia coli]|uniref:helix-turn-helix domain-containing protein n=1 Tax=Escherichia coli TaxID=562 RepID=UPI00066BD8B4|nr:helix-turn-helix transcriptional regulator [Escherichia coli]EFC1616860.1 helix-turn-helix transcriptional regulator [Escherichia coli]EKM0745582.1 helix-turn-helix transcriptional regulator [Escherichia coli]ELS7766681.1 helix-turn-helix transcriptional regulator [Escherichia coli]KMV40059.1 repressor [Escherichia coli]KMV50561.1 repressor [Escherichia coli]
MKLGEKLKAIRAAEGLSQNEFCEFIDLSINTLRKYETGGYEPGGSALVKIAQHPRFQKYTLWLMSDITAPEAGQIAPVTKEEKKTG